MGRDDTLLAGFDRHVAGGSPGRLALVAWSLSCAGLAGALALYVALTPGFATSLLGGGPAAGYLLRQIVFNGLPVVFAVNLAGLWLYARVARGAGRPWGALALDAVVRAVLFIGLHAAIYAGAARAFGSFGGDAGQAVRVVGPTLAAAASFGNLSGVYLYATAVSAFPLFAAAVVERRGAPPLARPLVWMVPAFAVAFAAYAGLLSLVASRL
jgi:hypothetical protein